MILSIIGGLLMIISGIANIVLLFNMIYSNIIPIIGIETLPKNFLVFITILTKILIRISIKVLEDIFYISQWLLSWLTHFPMACLKYHDLVLQNSLLHNQLL